MPGDPNTWCLGASPGSWLTPARIRCDSLKIPRFLPNSFDLVVFALDLLVFLLDLLRNLSQETQTPGVWVPPLAPGSRLLGFGAIP